MKNVQVIDDGENCVYDIFAASEKDFASLFPKGTDIAFAEDFEFSGPQIDAAFNRLWAHPVRKSEVQGIHGTIFYGLEHKRQYYPTLRDEEAVNPGGGLLRAPRAKTARR